MVSIGRIIGIGMVFIVASIAWMFLGGVTSSRSEDQYASLGGSVAELWGTSQQQTAPEFMSYWTVEKEVTRTEEENGKSRLVKEKVTETQSKSMSPSSTTITADLNLDQRRKGLVWYSLYNLDFDGKWTYTHTGEAGWMVLSFKFPDAGGLYDGFKFIVNGTDQARVLRPEEGVVHYQLPIKAGDNVTLEVAYKTRGASTWQYMPAAGVANLENFSLNMTTDFENIDYPSYAMSPSNRTRTEKGWALSWKFAQLVTGHNIGMVMPDLIQPGELATELTFSAPISLFFFFLVIFVLATLRRIDLHPINYLFIAGAFFAFHLLFAYSADLLPVEQSFALSSVVSIVLVVSYLRLAVGNRFAFVEAALAQFVYLIVFSMAHFWKGYTGLTVTVLSILTLFVLMQLTGRISWTEVLGGKPSRDTHQGLPPVNGPTGTPTLSPAL